jgi:hypothetical protein
MSDASSQELEPGRILRHRSLGVNQDRWRSMRKRLPSPETVGWQEQPPASMICCGGERDLPRVVVGHAIDKEEEGIDSCLVG